MKQNNTEVYYTPIQLKLPVDLQRIIKINDSVYTFSEAMAHIDLKKYFVEKEHETGRPRYMFKQLNVDLEHADIDGTIFSNPSPRTGESRPPRYEGAGTSAHTGDWGSLGPLVMRGLGTSPQTGDWGSSRHPRNPQELVIGRWKLPQSATLTTCCGKSGRSSDCPPGSHSLLRLRFAYPQNEGRSRV